MSKKNYMITVTGYARVLVLSAESEEKAIEYAHTAMSTGDFQIEKLQIDRVVSDEDFDVENARVEADMVAEDYT